MENVRIVWIRGEASAFFNEWTKDHGGKHASLLQGGMNAPGVQNLLAGGGWFLVSRQLVTGGGELEQGYKSETQATDFLSHGNSWPPEGSKNPYFPANS